MKVRFKWLSVLLAALLMFAAAACGKNDANTGEDPDGDGTGGGDKPVTETIVDPPEAVNKVTGITIIHNEQSISGLLSKDKSDGSVALSARVDVIGEPQYTVAFSSSDPAVATVSVSGADATVTLTGGGETVITASAGGKEKKIVLSVFDEVVPPQLQSHTVTVIDGSASVSSAAEGSHVVLTAGAASRGHKFAGWEYFDGNNEEIEDLWVNGNIFAMPDYAVTVRAVFEKVAYNLTVIGGGVITVNGEPYEGEANGDGEVNVPCYYEDEVELTAGTPPTGKMFVGWDKNIMNLREGEGNKTIGFEMPDANQRYEAIFSQSLNVFNNGSLGLDGNTTIGLTNGAGNWGRSAAGANQSGATAITNGVVQDIGTTADPDLEGMSGVALSIPGNVAANTIKRLRGSDLNNMRQLTGGKAMHSITIDLIFKNRSTEFDITVELFAESYDAIATTGTSGLLIPKNGGVVKKSIVVPHGFITPYFVLCARQNVGGTASQFVPLDIVARQAATYPVFDPNFEINAPVTLSGSYAAVGTAPSGDKKFAIDNPTGVTMFYGVNTAGYNAAAAISNLPTLGDGETSTTVYVRFINYVNYTLLLSAKFGSTRGGAECGSHDLTLSPYAIVVFAVQVNRSANPATVYFTFGGRAGEQTGNRQVFTIQLAYTNTFGVEE
ncbi:MAG: hypothetical protein LBP26_03080 [Clostridiales bacterium]|jgi:hypothetical protein|nr:hypothetical protein [Clostridiales bacterium]